MNKRENKLNTKAFKSNKTKLIKLINELEHRRLEWSFNIIKELPDCSENQEFVQEMLKHLQNFED